MNILLASASPIKIQAVERTFPHAAIVALSCSDCKLPEQPLDSGAFCAKVRLDYAKSIDGDADYVISIENSVDLVSKAHANDSQYQDVCHVLIEHKGLIGYSTGGIGYPVDSDIAIAVEVVDMVHKSSNIYANRKTSGSSTTAGQLYQKSNSSIDHKNWVKTVYQSDRIDQITSSLTAAWLDLQEKITVRNELISLYKVYENYPKPGVVFEDFFSVVKEASNLKMLVDLMVSQCRFDDFDYVVGPESRGFFGFGISCVGGYGFIPIRKQGKLPGECYTQTYNKEYGTDTLELQVDIKKGSRVLVFDDLIGTGGSLKAARDLLEKAECVIVDYIVLREVKSLRETAKATLGKPYRVLLQDC